MAAPPPKPAAKPTANNAVFIGTLVLSVMIGILVFVGGAAWASAAHNALRESKVPGAPWIYALVITIVLVGMGIVIATVLQKLNIRVPLEVSTVISNPDVSGTTQASGAVLTLVR